MPVHSKAEFRLMQAMMHGAKARGGDGPSPAVAKEMISATPKGAYKSLPERKGKSKRKGKAPPKSKALPDTAGGGHSYFRNGTFRADE
jgi:hypothetical protein